MEKNCLAWLSLYIIVSYSAMITISYLVLNQTDPISHLMSQSHPILQQVAQDWTTDFYTQIWPSTQSDCGQNATELFGRLYQGTSLGCDCLDISSANIDNPNQMTEGKECNRN